MCGPMAAGLKQNRIFVIDIARFYAIALVFYGHFIEELMLLKNPAAASHYKFIYAFHMVLFVFLAGYVSNESHVGWNCANFLKHRFFSRLLPFIFFTILMMIPPLFVSGKFFGLPLLSFWEVTKTVRVVLPVAFSLSTTVSVYS